MEMGRCLVHVQHHIEHPQMGVAFCKRLRKIFQSCRRPFSVRRTAPTVAHVADLEDRFMEQLLLFPLADMLIVVCDLIPGLFLFGVVGGQGFIEKLVVDLFQIVVAVGHILLRAAPVYIRRKKLPVIVADTAWAHHAGYSRTDKITHPFYRPNLLPIPSYHSPRRGATPLCYFLRGESNAKALSHRRPVGASV